MSMNPPRKRNCYEERHIVHILTEFTMGTPVAVTFTDAGQPALNGYFLAYDRSRKVLHIQPGGESAVREFRLSDICTIRYRSI